MFKSVYFWYTVLVIAGAALLYGTAQEIQRNLHSPLPPPPPARLLMVPNRAVCFDFQGHLALNVKDTNMHFVPGGIGWNDEKGSYMLSFPSTGLLCSIIVERKK